MRKALPYTALLCLFLVAALLRFGPLVPADRTFEFDDGFRVRLLGIRTVEVEGAEHVTWTVAAANATHDDLALIPRTTCRHLLWPRDAGVEGAPVAHEEVFEVPAGQSSTWSDSCPSPGPGRWYLYSLSFEDPSGRERHPTAVFVGKAR